MKLSLLLSAASFISTSTIGASHTIPLEHVGNDGSPSDAFPLGLCQGDCDSDADCQTGLVTNVYTIYSMVHHLFMTSNQVFLFHLIFQPLQTSSQQSQLGV